MISYAILGTLYKIGSLTSIKDINSIDLIILKYNHSPVLYIAFIVESVDQEQPCSSSTQRMRHDGVEVDWPCGHCRQNCLPVLDCKETRMSSRLRSGTP